MARCVEGKCIAGIIGGEDVSVADWGSVLQKHYIKVEEFCTSRKALNHPGHVYPNKFCINCGTKIERT